jgi:hypothetical protein
MELCAEAATNAQADRDVAASPSMRGPDQEREAFPVTGNDKGALPIARRRKRQRRSSRQAERAIPPR